VAFTHTYRVRIGPWGLVARVRLDVRPVAEPPRAARRVGASRVWWLPPPRITSADERWLAFGLGLVAGQLDALAHGSGAVLVRVDDYGVPMPADHQDEVAAAAVIECLRENLGITGVEIGLTFDRERNRYEFTWDASTRPARRGCGSDAAGR